ncbi:MAG: hypothetical protein ABEJ66_03015 [Candidatus Nanohaloarchaea archaeon]
MPRWECQDCGNTVEAPSEPEQCPCGSENIEQVEQTGFIDSVRDTLGL